MNYGTVLFLKITSLNMVLFSFSKSYIFNRWTVFVLKEEQDIKT